MSETMAEMKVRIKRQVARGEPIDLEELRKVNAWSQQQKEVKEDRDV